jgi:hypothetical protein
MTHWASYHTVHLLGWPMEQEELETICKERFDCWFHRCVDHGATPVLVLAVGHNKDVGRLHLIVPHDIDMDKVKTLVYGMTHMIEGSRYELAP